MRVKPRTVFLIISVWYFNVVVSGCSQLKWLTNSISGNSEQAASPEELEQNQVEQGLKRIEIVLGMKMHDVRSIWGDPEEVESAGAPQTGNQRWIYFNGLSSRWSLRTARIIYFEDGQVVGWETSQAD
jgi:hypothetical protein